MHWWVKKYPNIISVSSIKNKCKKFSLCNLLIMKIFTTFLVYFMPPLLKMYLSTISRYSRDFCNFYTYFLLIQVEYINKLELRISIPPIIPIAFYLELNWSSLASILFCELSWNDHFYILRDETWETSIIMVDIVLLIYK